MHGQQNRKLSNSENLIFDINRKIRQLITWGNIKYLGSQGMREDTAYNIDT